jgi:hypothetical protein
MQENASYSNHTGVYLLQNISFFAKLEANLTLSEYPLRIASSY